MPVAEVFPDVQSQAIMDQVSGLVRSYGRSLQSDRRHLLDQFRLVQVARKVVGVGSVGTRAWVLLLVGDDNDDSLLLQAKEAESSVLEEFVGASEYPTHGERVVAGQHLMQAASDIFLGFEQVVAPDGVTRDYYVRQLRDWKGSFDVEGAMPAGLIQYAEVCAQALARAHARSGDRIAIASYLGKTGVFDQAIAAFAETYADQNERDYAASSRPRHPVASPSSRVCSRPVERHPCRRNRLRSSASPAGRWHWPCSSPVCSGRRCPSQLRNGDARWWFLAVEVVLLGVLIIGDPGRIDRDRRWLRVSTSGLIGIITLTNAAAAIRLVASIVDVSPFTNDAKVLLASGGAIWLTNVIAFALWYWDLDRGGPVLRARGDGGPPP